VLAGAEGQEEAKGWPSAFPDWEPKARESPRAPSRGGEYARARPASLACGYTRVYPMGMAPEPPGDPRGVCQGVFGLGTFDPKA
jgi:hypothetical protein